MRAFAPVHNTPTLRAHAASALSQPIRISNNGSTLTGHAFQQQVAVIRSNLLRELAIFNIVILVIGSFISYALARRTLRPMEMALETQERFAADASHELRTPLATMLAEIDITLRNPAPTVNRFKKALISSREELLNLQDLSEHLLELTRLEDNPGPRQLVDLRGAAQTAVSRLHKVAVAKRITIVNTTPELRSKVDLRDITEVCVILLDNALKYSAADTTIAIDGYADSKFTYLRVRDQGVGIDPQDLPRIFNRFFRADVSRSNNQIKGYGLGLSLAQVIMHQSHGDILVKSEPEVGSEFTIKIPTSF